MSDGVIRHIGALIESVESSCRSDDRYPQPSVQTVDDRGLCGTIRYPMGPGLALGVTVTGDPLLVRVGLHARSEEHRDEVIRLFEEAGETIEQVIPMGFAEAGLDWPSPPVEHDERSYTTPLDVEYPEDLSGDEVTGRVLRMLEGYFIAFGPAFTGAADHEV